VGSSLNVYSQIALIILIGLSAKNGILIVEFANQLRKDGKNIQVAIVEAATIRLRPILMTSLSTIFGVLPLIVGTGPGAASRLTVGVTIFGGMLFSTFFTLYVIPVIYTVIGRNTQRIDAVEIELNKQFTNSKLFFIFVSHRPYRFCVNHCFFIFRIIFIISPSFIISKVLSISIFLRNF